MNLLAPVSGGHGRFIRSPGSGRRRQHGILPDDQVVGQFPAWMQEHGLGRKRLLDTLLAATYYRSGVTRIVTSNARDYRVFGVFDLIEI